MSYRTRPAALAVAGNRMLIELLSMIWSRRYNQIKPRNLGGTLELMLVSMLASVATFDGKPPTASEIAKRLTMPRSNVVRHLDRLSSDGSVARVGTRYHSNLEMLDGLMLSLSYLDHAINVMEACVRELRRLRPLLRDQMQP